MNEHNTAPQSLQIAPSTNEPLRNGLDYFPMVSKPYSGHYEAVKRKGNGQRADLGEVI